MATFAPQASLVQHVGADRLRQAGRERDDAGVDCVLVNGLFNLAPNKGQVLAEVARVTRPGGRLVAAETILTRPLGVDEVSSLDDWFR